MPQIHRFGNKIIMTKVPHIRDENIIKSALISLTNYLMCESVAILFINMQNQ